CESGESDVGGAGPAGVEQISRQGEPEDLPSAVGENASPAGPARDDETRVARRAAVRRKVAACAGRLGRGGGGADLPDLALGKVGQCVQTTDQEVGRPSQIPRRGSVAYEHLPSCGWDRWTRFL